MYVPPPYRAALELQLALVAQFYKFLFEQAKRLVDKNSYNNKYSEVIYEN